jgi:predicted membrane-bound spermidine synthase
VPPPKRLLPILAVASGWCGIAYELLYSRALTAQLGDMFHVNAAILVSFLLGIGAGAQLSRRAVRWLWAVELAIGGYALVAAAVLGGTEGHLLAGAVPGLSAHPAAVVALGVALTLAPALLVGFSVPLFALYLLQASGGEAGDAFRRAYRLYNAGAAACVLALELWLLRWLGLQASLVLLALVNGGSGVLLRSVPPPPRPGEHEGPRASAREVAALVGASALSGLFQLFFLKLTEILFGPFHENFAALLALALLGIAAGTAWVQRRRASFQTALAVGATAVGLSLAALRPWVHVWGALNSWLGVAPAVSGALKLLVLAGMGLPAFAAFGATVPALVGEGRERREAGRLLALSSYGNCAGYLLAALVVYQRLSYGALAAVLAFGLWACAVLATRDPGRELRRLSVPAAGALALLVLWDEPLWRFSYREYLSPEALAAARGSAASVEVLRRFDTEVKLLRDKDGETALLINGYRSLVASRSGQTNRKELVVGAAPALFAARREHALVLGVGTGITAGAAAPLFGRLTGVEINPAVVAALPRFREHNLGLTDRPGFQLVVEDGLTFLARTQDRYDAIINTVTSPLFFSSSKLYTREMFELARSRLADGGVYAMWFDARVTEEGARIIFETLRRSFAECALVFLSAGYAQVVCGTGPLHPRPLPEGAIPADLAARFASEHAGLAPGELLESLLLPSPTLSVVQWGEDVNTLDRPRLEFAMAEISLQEGFRGRPWTPYRLAQVAWGTSAVTREKLSPEALGRRCLAVRLMEGQRMGDCESALAESSGGSLPPGYLQALAKLSAAEGAPVERLQVADQLLRGALPEPALALLGSVEGQLGRRVGFQELRIRSMLALGQTPADEDLTRLYVSGPLFPEARRLLAAAAEKRGDLEGALAQARVLVQIAPPSAEDAALLRRLEAAVRQRGEAPR